jgi:hypothetical protein
MCREKKQGKLRRDTCGWTFEPVTFTRSMVLHSWPKRRVPSCLELGNALLLGCKSSAEASSAPNSSKSRSCHIHTICFDIALCCEVAWCLAAALRSNPRPSALFFGAPCRRLNSRLCCVDGNATASTTGGLLNDIFERSDEPSDLMWRWRSRAIVSIWEVRLSTGHGVTWFTSVITDQ